MRDRRAALMAALGGTLLLLSGCSDGDSEPARAPEHAPALQRLIEDARFEMREGRLKEAGQLFDEALASDPQSPAIWTDIARLRFRGGEHTGALDAADRALSLDPGFAPALLMRAQLVRDAHGMLAALAWFEAGLKQHPQDPDLLAEYAATLGDLGRHRDMLNAVRQLAEIDPHDPRVHFLQAVLAARANDPVLASSLLKRSGLREAGVPAAMLLGALVEMHQGNTDNASTALEALFNRQPANRRVMELYARSLWLSGRDRELVDRFAEMANVPDGSPYLSMLVGRAYERLGQRSEAATFIARARTPDTSEPRPLAAGGSKASDLPGPTRDVRRMVVSGQTSQARSYASNLLRRFSGSSDMMALAGDASLAAGNTAEALALYSRAAGIRRPWPLTRKIIHAYRLTGDEDAARTLLVRHLSAEPRNTEALLLLAQDSARDEDWLRVKLLLDSAIGLGAGNDPELLGLRLRAAEALGEADDVDRFSAWLADLRPDRFVLR